MVGDGVAAGNFFIGSGSLFGEMLGFHVEGSILVGSFVLELMFGWLVVKDGTDCDIVGWKEGCVSSLSIEI